MQRVGVAGVAAGSVPLQPLASSPWQAPVLRPLFCVAGLPGRVAVAGHLRQHRSHGRAHRCGSWVRMRWACGQSRAWALAQGRWRGTSLGREGTLTLPPPTSPCPALQPWPCCRLWSRLPPSTAQPCYARQWPCCRRPGARWARWAWRRRGPSCRRCSCRPSAGADGGVYGKGGCAAHAWSACQPVRRAGCSLHCTPLHSPIAAPAPSPVPAAGRPRRSKPRGRTPACGIGTASRCLWHATTALCGAASQPRSAWRVGWGGWG